MKNYSKYKYAVLGYNEKDIYLYKTYEEVKGRWSSVYESVVLKFENGDLIFTGNRLFFDDDAPVILNDKRRKKYHPSEVHKVKQKRFGIFGKMIDTWDWTTNDRSKLLKKKEKFYMRTSKYRIIIEDDK